ncbi:OsmC family protein [Tropicimonas aquimaris]|uniref:OsmC family protein n=1 Tax=Tropicimonas aquimaris TaxID=914152 RepID=A0ABW3ISS4_9RHOB
MKPATYGPVFVRMADDGALRFGVGSGAIDQLHPPSEKPAETLLAAIGSCMVLSIGIVAGRDNFHPGAFHVEVRATKAAEPPSHFGAYEIRVSEGLAEDPDLRADIAKRAKSICTISNSVNGDIVLLTTP